MGSKKIVQFIHQTAQEFAKGDEGRAVICENVSDAAREPGDQLMLRFAARCIPEIGIPDSRLNHVAVEHLARSALALEHRKGRCAGEYIETELLKVLADKQSYDLAYHLVVPHDFLKASAFFLNGDDLWYQTLTLYVLLHLHRSLHRCLERPEDSDFAKAVYAKGTSRLTTIERYRLLNAVMSRVHQEWPGWEETPIRVIDVLLQKCFGVGCEPLSKKKVAELAPSFYHVLSHFKLSVAFKEKLHTYGWESEVDL